MMRCPILFVFLSGLLLLSASGDERSDRILDLDAMWRKSNLKDSFHYLSEGALLEESVAVEQARVKANSRSEFGMELRPRVTDSEVGVALRMYLPDRWSKGRLREQLILVAQAEQLRVSALEWRELMDVYRAFCDYRMLVEQLEEFNDELVRLEPYLDKANEEVELNQLSVFDRARLYSLYLDLENNHERVKNDLLDTEQKLRLLLGVEAELAEMAEIAVLELPSEMEFQSLLQRALDNRSDYKQFEYRTRMLREAEDTARADDGFRLKYVQPFYEVDYNNGGNTVGISASLVLPWGTRNPDIAVFREEQLLAQSAMKLQKITIGHRLRVLLKTVESYYSHDRECRARTKPLIGQVTKDLETMNTGRLEDLRDLMLVRERILDVSLQTSRSACRKERIAVNLAEEIGILN